MVNSRWLLKWRWLCNDFQAPDDEQRDKNTKHENMETCVQTQSQFRDVSVSDKIGLTGCKKMRDR